ncbi:MAG: DUF1048 domain-containing protein [Bifidobacteriaceae bacterium]|jgi:DNA-binding ferritin-like protein (Dps family)|nr:DUF1048 domain-containing protein [Bifidobacteriaceae bacterium]
MKNPLDLIIGSKKRYNAYKKVKATLPDDYREAMDALEKYMWNFAKNDDFMDVLNDVLQMFQENVGDGSTPRPSVRSIVGEDPVEFADEIMAQYPNALWIINYRNKLRDAMKRVEANA